MIDRDPYIQEMQAKKFSKNAGLVLDTALARRTFIPPDDFLVRLSRNEDIDLVIIAIFAIAALDNFNELLAQLNIELSGKNLEYHVPLP